VSDAAAQAARLPEWLMPLEVVLLGLGFPITVGLAWAFDVTGAGVERTAPAGGAGCFALPGGRKLALVAGAMALLAASPGLACYFVWHRAPGPSAAQQADAAQPGAPAGPSIAVLPFVNLSSDRENEVFSDGIAEEILNALRRGGREPGRPLLAHRHMRSQRRDPGRLPR
jgi:hypothetical protein